MKMGLISLQDGVDITPVEFYKRLEKSSNLPTTSQPPAEEFLRIYGELAADYDGIIVPLISSGISGTVSSARTAASMFSKVPVEVIDTRSTAAGLAMVVTAIAKAVDEGKNLPAIKELTEAIVQRLDLFFAVDTLEYLHKGGRIGGASRYFGAALSIKPILYHVRSWRDWCSWPSKKLPGNRFMLASFMPMRPGKQEILRCSFYVSWIASNRKYMISAQLSERMLALAL
ncbi:MAG: DegV family protein [Deltaproteobacteria bacterium]|nr:DegV family protein [Deltaproteobacteria bacterium]